MNRGTTPTHTFIIPTNIFHIIKEIKITYNQNGNEILVKRTKDCRFENGRVTTKLSQAETFLFSPHYNVEIQLRVLTQGGDAISSYIVSKKVNDCLDDEVLV